MKVANLVATMRTAWDKTAYFGKAVDYPRVNVPTPSDILNPGVDHSAREKRPCTDLTLSTTVIETGDEVSGPRASSPANPEDVDVEGGAAVNNGAFLHLDIPTSCQPAMPSGNKSDRPALLQALPKGARSQAEGLVPSNATRSIEQWVAQMAAATVPDIGQQGSSGDPIIIHSPNSALHLILNQQAQLEEMRWQVEATKAFIAASLQPRRRRRSKTGNQ